MQKYLLLLLISILVACGPAESPPSDSATVVLEQETAGGEPAVASPTPADESEPAGSVAALLQDEFVAATTAAQANRIRPMDHVLGGSDPAITIIEYGDFQ